MGKYNICRRKRLFWSYCAVSDRHVCRIPTTEANNDNGSDYVRGGSYIGDQILTNMAIEAFWRKVMISKTINKQWK
jgi:hypothetical protein